MVVSMSDSEVSIVEIPDAQVQRRMTVLARDYRNMFLVRGSEPDETLKPPELFAACHRQEQNLHEVGIKKMTRSTFNIAIFGAPLFHDEPVDFANDFYPLRFTISRPKGSKVSRAEWQYTELLRQLKNLKEIDLRWLLIAQWLVEEGVCHPEDFLPRGVLERVYRRINKRMIRISPTDLHSWRLVEIWVPFFKRLLSDRRDIAKKTRRLHEELRAQGYKNDAIEASSGKHRVIPAVTSWLESRAEARGKNIFDARTLENKHSRVEVAVRNADSAFQKLRSDLKPL
jgi:hypothetical protein